MLRAAGLAMLLAYTAAHGAPPAAAWVLVDTQAFTLTVFDAHKRTLARYRNISIGRGGAADVHYEGDDTTPRGTFRIARVDRRSRFGIFFAFDYPTPAMAVHAYLRDRITYASFAEIIDAYRGTRMPPQDTALGGALGIHGIGEGSPVVQRDINWTKGCIAVTNRQALELSRWVHVGTKVVIR